MAKVDRIQIQFKGEYKQFDVCFTKSDQFFIKDCLTEIAEYGEFNNRERTLGDILQNFKNAVIKADEALMSSRKVILVLFSMSSQLISEPTTNGGFSCSTNHPLYKFCASFGSRFEGYGFSIDYRIALEVSRGTEKLYYNTYYNDITYRMGALTVKNSETPIPYSDKAIETLENIKSSMKNMVFSIANIFSDPNNLQIALETGNLKMLSQ